MEAIGTLAGGLAHDFNNLLQGVFGFISMAKIKMDNKENAVSMLEQAENALKMSVNLTAQLLTFSKGGKPVKKRLDLLPVIENATKFALSGSRSDYRFTYDHDLWPVEADEGQIAQVIQNIVLNAKESMPDGGTIEIAARNSDVSRADNALVANGGKFILIDIRDSGMGIPEKYLSRIFDPYFTTKQKGSGLGLATSYSIIKNHGGMIDVESETGKGSVFHIYLRVSEAAAEKTDHAAAPVSARKGRILVMDDEEVVRLVVKEMVESLGHEVTLARDGEDAIEKFVSAGKSGRPFDIVILDLTVKGGIGGELTAVKLREIDPDAKIVVSSGYSDNPVVSDYRSYGFVASLGKPFTLSSLKDSINSLLG